MQTVKRGLKKNTEGYLTTILARILYAYRTTPQSTTGVSPAQLLLGRQPRTCLALLRPNITSHVEDKQSQQKNTHDKKARARNFNIGDSVLIRNIGSGQKWVIGTVIQITGPVSYMVRLKDYTIHRRHQDQLRIFRGSVDTDVSLADVPLVENSTEVTSPTVIKGVHQPELELPVPTVQSNRKSQIYQRPQNNHPNRLHHNKMCRCQHKFPPYHQHLQQQSSASTSSASVSSSDYTRSQPTPVKTYPKRKRNPPECYK